MDLTTGVFHQRVSKTDTEMSNFIRSSFDLLKKYLSSACCIPGTVLGGREILIFVFRVVMVVIWTVLAILFQVWGGGAECNIWTSQWGKQEVIPARRRLPGSWELRDWDASP